ncbi:MAG: glycosyltransferase family 4 protein [Chloroflexi bacterium]|nr:glycosyltransferase family 4 protein [Chloroflexota bacterium]
MHIVLVNTRHFHGGGDSTYTFNLAELLRSKGHRVSFFAMQDRRNLPDPNSDLFVSYIDFRELNRHKTPISGVWVLGRVIYSMEARQKFSRLLDRAAPDIIHLQNIHAHITPSVVFEARRRGLPVVWTLHDYKLICPNTHFLKDAAGEICEACKQGSYYQAALSRCKKGSLLASTMAAVEAYAHFVMKVRDQVDAFLAPSAFLRSKLIASGFPPPKVQHLPLFLPSESFEIDEDNDRFFLFMGKLDEIKGIRVLLDACRHSPHLKVILAGRIEEPLARDLPTILPANAQYVGMKNRSELRQLLRRSLAVVVPSLWYENQPFSILEAFACAKPVIASDLGGMTELVKHNERGVLVPRADAKALSHAMEWLIAHQQEAQLMGRAAYAYTREYHSEESHYMQIMELYTRLTKRRVKSVATSPGIPR